MEKDPYFNTPEEIAGYENREHVRPWFRGVFDLIGLELENGKKSSLDVGCGFGYLVELFQENGWDAYGVDISPYAIKRAGDLIPKERLSVTDVSKEKPFDRKFDVITCFGVLGFGSELIVSKEKVVENCFEMLADDGVFIASAPNVQRPGFIRRALGKMDTIYKNAITAKEWAGFLSHLGESEVHTIQRLPLPQTNGKYSFIKAGWGDPIIIVLKKKQVDQRDESDEKLDADENQDQIYL